MTYKITYHAGPDPTIIRYLDCEDRPIVRHSDSERMRFLKITDDGFLTEGRFHDGRAWAVEPLMHGCARLHVWTPGKSIGGTSDLVFDYHHPASATLAALDWEGIGPEPLWWHRCRQTGRRRYYKSDGTFREEVQE